MRFPLATMVVLATLAAAGPTRATDGWWDDIYEQKTVTLEEILERPQAFRGIDVSFVLQFRRLGKIENPYYTRFEKDRFVNFVAWSDRSRIWRKEEYDAEFPYLFSEREAEHTKLVVKAREYDRFVVMGRVEAVFRGKPWIEVTGLKPLDEKMTEPVLIRMVKAYNLKRVHRYDAAASEFNAARMPKLPPFVQGTLLRETGMCLAAANRLSEALVPLERAVSMFPGDEKLRRTLDHCRRQLSLPAAPPGRRVKVVSVPPQKR